MGRPGLRWERESWACCDAHAPSQAHAPEVAGLQLEKYVASAVVVCNTQSGGSERWRTHLDLSTDTTAFRAYMYSSPTVVDVDGDGNMEIIVGTSMVRGHLAVF